ncbi:ABC transporter ATP-binding protein [Carboxydochorda subterranea]|uniref:ABC transporter ATP-binding protein n=1 Tax=Carboxydichorda subterranea TaxID=3109565 RepID=A0ABZ1BVY1_9FIRM|nr:ABC transporter ATP-binding protein [Limnochorda sp. L945t]WRP16273.1 ABC transporter ATP-binding protein [Limnochorda sp. L945t]
MARESLREGLELEGISRSFRVGSREVWAVQDVSLEVGRGETFCLVGESGCGKTTTGRIAAGLIRPTRGTVRFRGDDVWRLSREDFATFRRSVQIIHQNPYASLNPLHSVEHILAIPLQRHHPGLSRREARQRAAELLTMVGLTPPGEFLPKLPHQLSGGQRQRVSIARSMTVEPSVVVADEPVSMVDVSLRAGILKVLERLRDEAGVGFVFITHDLAVARYFGRGGSIGVMYLGRMVEQGPTEEVVARPIHPYTRILLDAVAEPDPARTRTRRRIEPRSMDVPSLLRMPPGCPFHPRCPWYEPGLCDASVPPLRAISGRGSRSASREGPAASGRAVACHRVDESGELPPMAAVAPSGQQVSVR